MRRTAFLTGVLLLLAGALACREQVNRAVTPVVLRVTGRKTVAGRLSEFGPAARRRWAPHFERAGVPYPPERVVLVGLKRERLPPTTRGFTRTPNGVVLHNGFVLYWRQYWRRR